MIVNEVGPFPSSRAEKSGEAGDSLPKRRETGDLIGSTPRFSSARNADNARYIRQTRQWTMERGRWHDLCLITKRQQVLLHLVNDCKIDVTRMRSFSVFRLTAPFRHVSPPRPRRGRATFSTSTTFLNAKPSSSEPGSLHGFKILDLSRVLAVSGPIE